MTTGVHVCKAVAICFIMAGVLGCAPDAPSDSLNHLLEPTRVTNQLPALAAAVVRDGQIVASGVVGKRKLGSPERVTINDRWHIGSCTKSMTAALAGMLVDDGLWRWDMPATELHPHLADNMAPAWRHVTLEQFLTHHSGAGNLDRFDSGLVARTEMPPLKQRARFVEEFLTATSPTTAPGTKWEYDNANYAIVGHAMELRLNQPWESIIRERLFGPLRMESAGFGPPASDNAVDQPWGHVFGDNGEIRPVPPDYMGESGFWVPELQQEVRADNPAALGPGGTVNCSIGDLAKYAAWQLRGARGDTALLRASTIAKLHTRFREDGNYACGWFVEYRAWAGGDALFHEGSNGTFMTVIWLAPDRNFAVVVCTNLGGRHAEVALDEAVGILTREYLEAP